MANPNFFFTDPVAAQQAVQMFQLEQAGREALRRNATDNIRTFAQTNTARENAAGNRAITEGQLAQRDRELAQNQRQFDEGQKYRERALDVNRQLTQADIDARRTDANRRLEDQNQVELFNALQSEVQSQDPPTDLEFEARAGALSPQRRDILNRLRVSTIRLLNDQADRAESVAAQWNAKLQGLKPDDVVERRNILKAFESSKDRNFLDLDIGTGTFRSLVRRPRADARMSAMGGRTDGVTPIEEIRNRVRSLVGAGALGGPQYPIVSPVDSPGFAPSATGFQVPIAELGGPLIQAPVQAPVLQAPPRFIDPALLEPIQDPPPAPPRNPYNWP